MTALMEAVENQKQVYHRSHRPWKSLRDSHTPAARRLLIDKRNQCGPRCPRFNCLQACLNSGVQSILSTQQGGEQRSGPKLHPKRLYLSLFRLIQKVLRRSP